MVGQVCDLPRVLHGRASLQRTTRHMLPKSLGKLPCLPWFLWQAQGSAHALLPKSAIKKSPPPLGWG